MYFTNKKKLRCYSVVLIISELVLLKKLCYYCFIRCEIIFMSIILQKKAMDLTMTMNFNYKLLVVIIITIYCKYICLLLNLLIIFIFHYNFCFKNYLVAIKDGKGYCHLMRAKVFLQKFKNTYYWGQRHSPICNSLT